jgi:two-component system, sporulation sensor kinase D
LVLTFDSISVTMVKFNIYARKKQWKLFLFALAVAIVSGSMYYTSIIVRKVAEQEQTNVKIWADAIYRKTELVKYIEQFFQQIREEDRKSVVLLAEAYKQLIRTDDPNVDLTFYVDIIRYNSTIPIILTDEDGRIINTKNVDFNEDTVTFLSGKLLDEFSVYPPIPARYFQNKKNYLYYKDSKLHSELHQVLNDLVSDFFSEVVINAASVPVIITDSTKQKVIDFGNIEPNKIMEPLFVEKTIAEMAASNPPIEIELTNLGKSYIFYKGSSLLTQLRYFPIVQILIMGLFLFIGYMMFNTARRSEQNQVWVGLAKETAHQLGTPLSSMMAWMELLKEENPNPEIVSELRKDVERLEKVTDRFSKIGALPKLTDTNIVKVIHNSIEYLKTRTSRKITYEITPAPDTEIIAPINLHLFEWVIENLTKNAVDAMESKGTFSVNIEENNGHIIIDLTDTGKGIPKSKFKSIFNPGYSGKKRGWGLGLSLAQRIIRDYHRGKIFVKSSTIDKGTTFRIILRKKVKL